MEKKLIASLSIVLFISSQAFAGTCGSTERPSANSIATAKELLGKIDSLGVAKAGLIAGAVLSSKVQMQMDPVYQDMIKTTLDAQMKKVSDKFPADFEKCVDSVARMPKKELEGLKAGMNTPQMAQYYASLENQKNAIIGLWQLLIDGGNVFSTLQDLNLLSGHMISFISLGDLSALDTLSAQEIDQVKVFLSSALYKKFIKVSSNK